MLLPINPRGRTAFIITLLGLALGLLPWCGESSHALLIASARAATAGAAADSPTQTDPGSNSSDPETEAQGEERAATAEADLVIVLERTLERDEPILQSRAINTMRPTASSFERKQPSRPSTPNGPSCRHRPIS